MPRDLYPHAPPATSMHKSAGAFMAPDPGPLNWRRENASAEAWREVTPLGAAILLAWTWPIVLGAVVCGVMTQDWRTKR